MIRFFMIGGSLEMKNPESESLSFLQSQVLTREEAARIIRVSPKTIYRLCCLGRFPAPDFRIGRSPRWLSTTIESWISRSKPSRGRRPR